MGAGAEPRDGSVYESSLRPYPHWRTSRVELSAATASLRLSHYPLVLIVDLASEEQDVRFRGCLGGKEGRAGEGHRQAESGVPLSVRVLRGLAHNGMSCLPSSQSRGRTAC